MLDYLLKSGGCLLVFYVFYVLFLERENMHVYKRVYLLATIAVSFIIPFITFTNYIEVAEQIAPIMLTQNTVVIPVIEEVESVSYVPMILWGIYGLGLLVFSIKFIKNITDIFIKVKNNPKEKNECTVAVLLEEDIVPHTFFNFIFFNKQQFKTDQIPKEVILHEETHARQKHSIDVLLLEFLQVVFWFNPLVYLLKRAIKLNHEFLADQSVLNNGANTKTYQKTLLAYSSNACQELPITIGMANAINYSSIKKRFTVMKTQTSKKKIWIRSFILLPVLALLLFSFSTTVQQERATPQQIIEYNTLAKKYNKQPKKGMVVKLKEVNRIEYLYKLMTPSQRKTAEKFPSFPPMPASPKVIKGVNDSESSIPPPPKSDSKRPITLVNGKTSCDGCVLELTKEEFAKIVLSVDKGEVTRFLIKFPKRPTVRINNSPVLNKEAKTFLQEAKIGQMVQIFGLKSSESDLRSAPVLFKIIE